MNIAEDIIMTDENANPNIMNKTQININNNIDNNNKEEDVEMKIENNNNIINKEIISENKKNSNPQNVDEYFEDICEELSI